MSLDYMRFNSDGMLNNYKMERDAIRKYDKETPITTNLMGTYKGLDYFKWAKRNGYRILGQLPELQYTMEPRSYDPRPDARPQRRTVHADGADSEPAELAAVQLLKETGPDARTELSDRCTRRRHDSVFQLRRSVGGCEKFHGAVIAHAGTADTRVFCEVTQLGKELEKIGSRVMGSENHAKVGIIFDWENYWALEYTSGPNRDLRYVDQIEQMYNYFYNKNIAVDMIPIDADFSKYDLVAAPVLYMVKDGVAESLEAYVQAGGTLITTYMSGIVGQSDNVHLGGYPGPLRKWAGSVVEEMTLLHRSRETRSVSQTEPRKSAVSYAT